MFTMLYGYIIFLENKHANQLMQSPGILVLWEFDL